MRTLILAPAKSSGSAKVTRIALYGSGGMKSSAPWLVMCMTAKVHWQQNSTRCGSHHVCSAPLAAALSAGASCGASSVSDSCPLQEDEVISG